jgi:DNA-binding protein YbaB
MTETPFGSFDFVDIIARAQEQMSEIAELQKQQVALVASATVADGLVTVSVNAQGVVIETKIDRDYFDEFDLDDLSKHITEAAQAAARDVQSRAQELIAPALNRRAAFPSFSEFFEGAPDIGKLVSEMPKPSIAPPNASERLSLDVDLTDRHDDDGHWDSVRG